MADNYEHKALSALDAARGIAGKSDVLQVACLLVEALVNVAASIAKSIREWPGSRGDKL